jgi:hypothetical protein
VDGRRSEGRTTQVAPEGRPLRPGGSRLLLTHLHIIILKEKGDYFKDSNNKESLKGQNWLLMKNNFQAKIRKKKSRNITETNQNLTCPEIKLWNKRHLKEEFIIETWLQP